MKEVTLSLSQKLSPRSVGSIAVAGGTAFAVAIAMVAVVVVAVVAVVTIITTGPGLHSTPSAPSLSSAGEVQPVDVMECARLTL
jgi:hypothetical protein